MYPHHPYDMIPARPISPPDEPWKCSECGHTCAAWRCEICQELHCGYSERGAVSVITRDGKKCSACPDCATVNIEDCAVRDLRQAIRLLDIRDMTEGEYADLGMDDDAEYWEETCNRADNAQQYLRRQCAEEMGIGFAEFCHLMFKESLAALRRPHPTEAHDYTTLYAERFGEVRHA